MILSASRRTDIPAFFSDWFFNRLTAGFVCVRNPMNAHQVSHIDLSPEVVDCIVFWSKNPAPMLPRLPELVRYTYYFQYTLNNYGVEVEPYIPALDSRIETFHRFADEIGKERVIWRYDPILFTKTYTPEFHLKSLEYIAGRLRGAAEKCVVSLVDVYPSKNAGNLSRLGSYLPDAGQLGQFFTALAEITRKNGFTPAACAEAVPLDRYGIVRNSCIDRALIERIVGGPLRVSSDGQRPNCLCARCEDIGSYDTCPHGCAYCYANFRPQVVRAKLENYDANSELLCDRAGPLDRVTERHGRSLRQKSTQDGGQLTFFQEGSEI